MQTYEILVRNRAVLKNSEDMTLVRTSIGIDQVHILFDNDEWLDFPIKITFSQGEDVVTQPLTVSLIDDSDEWVAEATVTVPYEVIDMVGPINVTLQGTDSNGRHIITAKGAPLSVEEAGDVVDGTMPEDAPTLSEWEQAYANAMTLMNEMQSLRDNLESRLDAIVEAAESTVDGYVEGVIAPATTESLGLVQIGNGIDVSDGVISTSVTGMTDTQRMQLANLAILAFNCFDTSFDEQGVLEDGSTVKQTALPVMSQDVAGIAKVDGMTIALNEDGQLCLAVQVADDVEY